MLTMLITIYCSFSLNPTSCEYDMLSCIHKQNQITYEDSQWLDVPNEKMSIESLEICIKQKEGN